MPLYTLGSFVLDTGAYRLTRDGVALDVPPRQLDLLAYLAGRPAQLVTREELFRALWPDVIVSDNTLTQLVSDLRQTLGDAAGSPRYIQTVARRGYRFVCEVVAAPDEAIAPAAVVAAVPPAVPQRSAETSSLDVLRAVTEGRLQLETLDRAAIQAAIANFERAIALDPGFAGGFVGLANARSWQFEQTRHGFSPDTVLLAAAVDDARRAVALAPEYAEAHATLSFVLSASDRFEDAREAAGRAIQLQPNYWGHHFRLGHASWGEERLNALKRSLQLYPEFPFAHFQMAMVYVARHALLPAARVVEEGLRVQQRLDERRGRFPANGLHWMLGSIQLARDDREAAIASLHRELDRRAGGLYAGEFAVAALRTLGFALLADGRVEEAERAFARSLAAHPEQVRPHLGLATVARRQGRHAEQDEALARARDGISRLRRGGRAIEAALMHAGECVVQQNAGEAVRVLDRMLADAPAGHAGWLIPIDPLFAPLAAEPPFDDVLRRLASRAA